MPGGGGVELRTFTRRFALDEMVVVRERVLVERTRRTARTASL
jgi:hypothetical protein